MEIFNGRVQLEAAHNPGAVPDIYGFADTLVQCRRGSIVEENQEACLHYYEDTLTQAEINVGLEIASSMLQDTALGELAARFAAEDSPAGQETAPSEASTGALSQEAA